MLNDLETLPTSVLKSHSVSEQGLGKCAVRKLQSNLVICGLAGESEAERHRWWCCFTSLFFFFSSQWQQVTNLDFEVNIGGIS